MRIQGIVIIIVNLLLLCNAQEDDPDFIKIQSELELIKWDLQDECSDMARNEKSFLQQTPTGLRDKIRSETENANFLRTHAHRLKMYETVPFEMERNWTYFTKCGDALLSKDQYQALNVFANKNLELKLIDSVTLQTVNETQRKKILKEQDILNILASTRNASILEEVWLKWESGTKLFREWYSQALQLTTVAAQANEYEHVEIYWEMLTVIPSGYERSRNLYDEIEPLYQKLLYFVRTRINNYYNTTYEDYIPPYLTGSFMADDWSNIADILLPNPQLYYDIKVELEAREIRDFYKYASNSTKNLGFGDVTNAEFYKQSQFNAQSCDSKVFHYCTEHSSSVYTCNITNLNNYLKAYETLMEIGLTKVNFHSYVREKLRDSPVLAGMSAMSSLIGINGLVQNKILDKNIFSDNIHREENRMTVLLMLALRILPKIAYYHAMDQFRLDLLENNETPEEVFERHRQRIQGISTFNTTTAEFLRDERILYNQPYLSKMFAQFLQFQFLDYYQIDIFEEADISTFFNKDSTFRDFVHNIPNQDVPDLLSYYFNIDEISADPLLIFFAPLEAYLNDAPMEQAPYKIKQAKYVKPKTTTLPPLTKKQKMMINPRKKQILTTPKSTVNPINNATSEEEELDSKVDKNLKIIRSSTTQVGIYIGAVIVIITLSIILGGFVMKRRRAQRNNRRYNA